MADPNEDFDWEPQFEELLATGQRFKWGWNSETEEATIWEVAGPGDGLPTHNQQLEGAWGRPPSHSAGDKLGRAFLEPPRLSIQAYYGDLVPDVVTSWFREHYPDADIQPT